MAELRGSGKVCEPFEWRRLENKSFGGMLELFAVPCTTRATSG